MTRQNLTRAGVFLLCLLTLGGWLLPGRAAAQAKPPNVVLIISDDQRWDTLAYMPTVQAELVGRGVTFTNAFAVNPLCCPSRASILTGRYSHTTGVWHNGGRGFRSFRDAETLPVWLDRAGYDTALVGKYINGYQAPFSTPRYVPPGWDRWRANWGHPQLYFGYVLTNGRTVRRYGFKPADYATDVLGAEAARLIRESSSPFFLYFAPKAPHITNAAVSTFSTDPAPRHVDAFAGVPYTRPPSWNEPDLRDKPRWLRDARPIRAASLTELREEQLEALLALDEAVAGILRALEAAGELENTMIVFTSDNGYLWGEHRRVNKLVPYEESIRVPLVLRFDRLGAAARTEARPALNIDLAPTIAQLAGAARARVDGRSLVPLLTGTARDWRRSFLFEHGAGRPPAYCGVRGPHWKYVQYATREEELYDLAADPYELRNLARNPTHRARVMRGRVVVRASRCRPPKRYRPLRPCSRVGTDRGETIRGTRWRDWICADGGNDVIRVRGGGGDVVRCGLGRDLVYAGPEDRTADCERVRRG